MATTTDNTTNSIDIKKKLTSRKLWASIAGFVSMLLIFFNFSESDATQVASLIMAGASIIGYAIGEGLADSGDSMIELPETEVVVDATESGE